MNIKYFVDAPRRGFTLIELLIVIAIISISCVSLDAAIVHLLRESTILERSMAMQSESVQTLEALTRASGPTRYQPCSGPNDLMKGNFM